VRQPVFRPLAELLILPASQLAWPLVVTTSAVRPDFRPVTLMADRIYGHAVTLPITDRPITDQLRATAADLPPGWRWCGQLDPAGTFTAELLFDDHQSLQPLPDTITLAALSSISCVKELGRTADTITLAALTSHPVAPGGLVRPSTSLTASHLYQNVARIP